MELLPFGHRCRFGRGLLVALLASLNMQDPCSILEPASGGLEYLQRTEIECRPE